MLRNLIFILFYIIFSGVLNGFSLSCIFIFQCLLIIREFIIKSKSISIYVIFALGQIPVFLGNLLSIYNATNHIRTLYTFIIIENIDLATQILCIGSSLIFLGMEAAGSRKLPSIDIISSEKVADTIFSISLVLSITTLIFGNIIHLTGNFQKILFIVSTISILFLARLWGELENNKYRKYTITITVLQTIISLNSYLRTELITPMLFLFVGYFLGKKSIMSLFSYRIVPFVLFFLVFINVFSKLGASRSDFASAFVANNESVFVDRYKVHEEEAHSGFLDRESTIAQVTSIVGLVKKNGFYNGSASSPLFISLIPRFVWPDKPVIQLGVWFALEIGAAYKNDAGRANNSVNMTIPGEYYLDFGWIGVVISCFLIGIFVTMLWNSANFNSSPYNITGILFGGYLMLYTFIGLGADAEILVTFLSTYLFFLLLKKLI